MSYKLIFNKILTNAQEQAHIKAPTDVKHFKEVFTNLSDSQFHRNKQIIVKAPSHRKKNIEQMRPSHLPFCEGAKCRGQWSKINRRSNF